MQITLTSIRQRAADNSLEVKHILEAAALRIEGLSELLAELRDSQDWSKSNYMPDGTHVIPLAKWARVGSAYSRDGMTGLRALLNESGHESYVLAMLEELHSTEAVAAVMDFFSLQIISPEINPALALKIADSLNLILCFKPDVKIDDVMRERIRAFASALIGLCFDQAERAIPVLLLRAVGDESSMKLLDNVSPFTGSWASTIPITSRAIRKRLKTVKGLRSKQN